MIWLTMEGNAYAHKSLPIALVSSSLVLSIDSIVFS